ncbi:MAG: hypothetical protein PHU91_01830 [Candidatus Omnitrophica bacterium]|nr:hypothetical protein [Candidatus Omnitrophota bacterium]MDD5236395.1 hypothetical protein [Candidatus Omnitrophota bacterium]MDD5610687.1 hypothetical protein [Candidatus Omnitrophota bacterium]
MKREEKELFIKELAEKFFQSEFADGLTSVQISERDAIKVKEKGGDDALHFEVCFKPVPKDQIEIAFHDHLKGKVLEAKKARINKVMKEAKEMIRESRVRFRYDPEWRRYWSRLYTLYAPLGPQDVQPVLERLWVLIECLKPKLEKISWGR